MNKINQKGYTLVEVAIVLVIIGILIAGVLKGTAMIENSVITKTISDLQSIQVANKSFRSKYRAVPGDMSKAEERLSGCNSDVFCQHGNGNGLIYAEGEAFSLPLDFSGPLDTSENSERWQFWKHLMLAGELSGYDINAGESEDAVPYSELGGIYTVGSSLGEDKCGLGNDLASGLWVVVVKSISNHCKDSDAFPANPIMLIDLKIDDGNPNTGIVRAGDDST